MKQKHKMLLTTTSTIAVLTVPVTLAVSCGTDSQKSYILDGKAFKSKQEFIKYAKSKLIKREISDTGDNIWSISNGKKNQYFYSPQKVRDYIFKNKITPQKVWIPNKYKFKYTDPSYKYLNDDEISQFSKGDAGTYYSFRISGGKTILSEKLTNDKKENSIKFEATKQKAIQSFLQIHQIYRFNNLYFPDKDSLKHYLKVLSKIPKAERNILPTTKSVVFTGANGISSTPFDFNGKVDEKSEQYKRASTFIKKNAALKITLDGKTFDIQDANKELLSLNTNKVLPLIDYINVNKTKQRFIIDLKKGTKGTLTGGYLINTNGNMSHIQKHDKSWVHTEEKFDKASFKDRTIINLFNSAANIAFADKKEGVNILNIISNKSSAIKFDKKEEDKFKNFRQTLNEIPTTMSTGIGDALWEQQKEMLEGKRFSSFKALFYLRSWTLDKIMRDGVRSPNIINLINKFFNKGLEMLDYKIKELILPIAGKEVVDSVNLLEMADFTKQKNLFVDPDIMITSFYKGRYKKIGTTQEIYNPKIISFVKAVQIYFAVEGYKLELVKKNEDKIQENIKMLNQPQTNNGYPQPTVITNLDLYTFDYNNKNSSISTIKNVIFKDWVADTNYQKNLEDTKQKFKKNVESFLELQRLNFRKVNSFLSSEHKDFRNFKWDLNEMINILNDKTGYTKIEKAKLVKLCGVAMMDFLYNPQGKKDFLVNIQNNIKDANIQTKIKDDLQTSKIEFDEVISILNNPSKMIEKQANKVLKEFNKSIERDRISSTSLENPIELVKEVKEVFENVIEIAKEMNKMLSLVSAATGPLGKTVLLAFSVALDVLSAIVGEEVIDGFKFEYGNAKSIIWTGGQHTEHKFWGIKFPDTNVTDVDDLDLIKPIEVTNNYEKDFMFFEGKKYNNENNLISAWLDKIASMNTEDIPQNIKDKLNLQYSFNGKNASDISKLSKDVINNAVPQEFLEINGSLVSDLKTKKDFEVDKILNDIKPIWVAQLPKTTIDKNGVQHLENIPYKMPITNKVKLFGNPNEISNNDYLMIDANKKDAKLLSLEKVIDVFGKLFERKYMQMESKQISEYEALFTDDFDKQSNGFSEKTIYKAKSVGGEIEIFLDLNDAINWLLVHSNYSTIENHGEKVIYTYKGNDYLSVTDFINDLLSKQVKGGKQNANKIYKK